MGIAMIESLLVVGLSGIGLYLLSKAKCLRPDNTDAESNRVHLPQNIPSEDDRAVQNLFANVFAIMPAARQENIILTYMQKYKCSRVDAMKMAIDDRQKDADLAF